MKELEGENVLTLYSYRAKVCNMLMVLQCGIFPFPSKNLKGSCHETENGFNGCQVLDLKNFGLPEPIFNSFFM